MTEREKAIFDKLPPVPEGAVYSLLEVRTFCTPHPYCITPKHVVYASDHCGGFLSEDAIREAEKDGARCDTCRHQYKNLTFDEHKTELAVVIRVPDMPLKDLNTIEVGKYCQQIKDLNLGVDGFVFPGARP